MKLRTAKTTVAAACLIFGLNATDAFAADPAPCGPLRQITTAIPLTETAARTFTLPVTMNGSVENMLLDTGGMYSMLTPKTTDALKLKRVYTGPTLNNVLGMSTMYATRVADLRIGGLKGTDVPFTVMPANDSTFDGLMALAQLDQFDLDVDFGARSMKFMSPDHCKGHVIYWHGPTGIIPIRLTDQHAYVDVVLDGVTFHALIDTGATRTTLYANQAEHHFNLTETSSDVKFDGTLGAKKADGTIVRQLKMYEHRFQTLDFEGVGVSNPTVQIFHQNGGETYEDMILGMDVLSKLHLYFAFKEGTLYVSPGSPPPDAAPARAMAASTAVEAEAKDAKAGDGKAPPP